MARQIPVLKNLFNFLINPMDTLELTKKLISLPSYVDKNQNEQPVADFICEYISKNIPWLTLTKQYIGVKRYNIIAKRCSNPSVVFISHMDTVLPQTKKCFAPYVLDNRLYGLGACDMKGGMAASIMAVQKAGPSSKAALIFDCDEEYYFRGALALVNKYSLRPRLAIFPEPTDLQLQRGCRGVVEIEFLVKGKTAHAGVPKNGKNAITLSVELVKILETRLLRIQSPVQTTVNLSSLQGGIMQNGTIGIQANAVPDGARVLLDIRTGKKSVNAKNTFILINQIAKKLKIKIENEKTNLDYPPFNSKKEYMEKLETEIRKSGNPIFYSPLNNAGFFEASFFANKWNCETVAFGPGSKKTAHTKEEYVKISDLKTVENIFTGLIRR